LAFLQAKISVSGRGLVNVPNVRWLSSFQHETGRNYMQTAGFVPVEPTRYPSGLRATQLVFSTELKIGGAKQRSAKLIENQRS